VICYVLFYHVYYIVFYYVFYVVFYYVFCVVELSCYMLLNYVVLLCFK
jgi:hypothetical protein